MIYISGVARNIWVPRQLARSEKILLINIHNDVILRVRRVKWWSHALQVGSSITSIATIADWLAAYLIILSTVQSVVATAMVIIVTTCFDWSMCGPGLATK